MLNKMAQIIEKLDKEKEILLQENIAEKIFLVRGKRVIFDTDLASLYGVETKALKRAVKRNIERFPQDFMFELTQHEQDSLRRQFGTLKRGQHSKYLPYAFTEQGVAMLSSVLKSRRAILVNVQIMRIFTKFKRMLGTHLELRQKIDAMEKDFFKKFQKHDEQFQVIFEAIRQLLEPSEESKKKIGFHP